MKLLVVDDESPIRELIQYHAEQEGFTVTTAENGAQALQLVAESQPDLIVLDLMLPDMNGFDICRTLKHNNQTEHIPIIMVTAKTEDIDIVSGLELGADDYVTKPFSPKVLIARIRTLLRRTEEQKTHGNSEEITIGDIHIVPTKHEISVKGRAVTLSATEFSILQFLAENPGHVFSRQDIINAVKGSSYPVTDRSIDVQILSIRRKLEPDNSENSIIETLRGVGYRIREQ